MTRVSTSDTPHEPLQQRFTTLKLHCWHHPHAQGMSQVSGTLHEPLQQRFMTIRQSGFIIDITHRGYLKYQEHRISLYSQDLWIPIFGHPSVPDKDSNTSTQWTFPFCFLQLDYWYHPHEMSKVSGTPYEPLQQRCVTRCMPIFGHPSVPDKDSKHVHTFCCLFNYWYHPQGYLKYQAHCMSVYSKYLWHTPSVPDKDSKHVHIVDIPLLFCRAYNYWCHPQGYIKYQAHCMSLCSKDLWHVVCPYLVTQVTHVHTVDIPFCRRELHYWCHPQGMSRGSMRLTSWDLS